jgi:hypothetical protein
LLVERLLIYGELIATFLKKAGMNPVVSLCSLTPYQSPRCHDHKYIPQFISQLSTAFITAFFKEVASNFTINKYSLNKHA